jgi:hypothetical protein
MCFSPFQCRAALRGLAAILVAASAGCSNAQRLPAPFMFNNPGDVELVCFDNSEDANSGNEQKNVVLPWACCVSDDVDGCPPAESSVRHALVTQTARGEVAAIDLENSKVLDSERRVPGYTFVDVGGLPTAIVVPRTLPHSRDASGPVWTYVAGREANSIRAIATCRFHQGKACGPELEIETAEASLRAQTELPLPEAPHDMLLDPSGNALWVSLPKLGRIARVELGASALQPFAVAEGETAPRAPSYFVAASGLLDVTPPEPVAESNEYQAVCGLDYEFEPSTPTLPIAPRAVSSGQAAPTRMRLLPPDPGLPEAKPLLLVADVGQMVLHAFAIVDTEDPELGPRTDLEQRAVLPMGAPLRDFAVTPAVPAQAPKVDLLASQTQLAYAQPLPSDNKRYLYGIDARDGSVMVFDLTLAGDLPSIVPLIAPTPARDEINVQRNARDRLFFDGNSARALDVVDTRRQNATFCGQFPADAEHANAAKDEAGLKELIAQKKTELRRADPAQRPELQGELDALNASLELTQAATADALRGVFVIVAASDGRISVLDVHDLNLQCRARAACDATNLSKQREDSDDPALAVRRHAPRLLTAKAAVLLVGSRDDLAVLPPWQPDEDAGVPDPDADMPLPDQDAGPDEDAAVPEPDEDAALPEPADRACPPGYYPGSDAGQICVVADPWQARDLSWSMRYEGSIADVSSALLEREPGADRVTLWGPQGFDFCARGANAEDGLKVAIMSQPEPDVRGCRTPTPGHELLLHVVEAYQDRLVLVPVDPGTPDAGPDPDEPEDMLDAGADAPDSGADTEPPDAGEEVDLDELERCYPEFLWAQIRLHQQYLVSYASGVYLHRNQAAEGGVCVVNQAIDRRFTSRVGGPDWLFEDLWLSFKLNVPDEAEREDIGPVIQLTQQSTFLGVINIDSSSGRADALPSRVRFFPDTGDLFIVDGASQGLRRYLLEPFEADDSSRFR